MTSGIKSKIIKIITYTLVIIMLAIQLNTLNVEAKSYNINKATFDVEVLTNGDIEITETWQVEFNGEFSRFYKSLPPDKTTKVEDYSLIEINYATINGIECSLDGNVNERKDYTFNSDSDGDNLVLSWLCHFENENATYVVNYTIHDITKQTDNDNCVVAFRPVCVGFDKTIDNIEINLYTPDNATIHEIVLNSSKLSKGLKDNTARIYGENTSGLIRVLVLMSNE